MKKRTKIIIGSIIVIICVLVIPLAYNFRDLIKIPSKQSINCWFKGGKLTYWQNSCGKDCKFVRNPGEFVCLQAFTWKCICGDNKCWDGKKCVAE